MMSLAFVITSFKSVPSSLLQRELRFKLLSVIDGVRALILALAMVLFALAGLRYWMLVLGALLSATISTLLTLSARRYRFRFPRWQSLLQAITISSHILVKRVSWYAYSNADSVVAGRVLGEIQLGAYPVGWNLASTPVQYITALVGGLRQPSSRRFTKFSTSAN
jgi:teichuronic acid exporter